MQIAENASIAILLRKRDEVVRDLGPSIQSLWALAGDQIQDWPGRKKLWSALVPGIQFNRLSRWDELQAAVFARNVIAHAGGEVVAHERSNAEKHRKSLAKIGIELVGNRLWITPGAVETCGDVVSDFVLWLDSR
jgi:hypothetical protein